MFEISQSQALPLFADTITSGGVAVDLTTASGVAFHMRPVASASEVTLAGSAAITTAASGKVTYTWAAADTATPGEYRVWWRVTWSGGRTQDTPEAPLVVLGHAPTTTTDLCSLAEVRDYLQKGVSETTQDAVIQMLITQASKQMTMYAQREFVATASATRRFGVTSRMVDLAPYELRSASSVVLHPESSSPTTLTGTDYLLLPVRTSTEGTYTEISLARTLVLYSDQSVRHGVADLDVTGAWGMAAVPEDVRLACMMQVAFWIRRGVGVMTSGWAPDGTETVPGASPVGLAHAVRGMLDPYKRMEII